MDNKIEKIMELYKQKTQKECYKFEVEKDIKPGLLDNKIGGMPYLPIGEEIPLDSNNEPMSLLIQINLENVQLEDYPQEGILQIFIDKECSWPCEYKIKYYPQITEYKTDLDDSDFESDIIDRPLKIKLIKDIEHMPISDYRFNGTMKQVIKEVTGEDINEDEIDEFFEENGHDLYDDFEKTFGINNFQGNLGGYADFTQTDPRPIENDEDKIECLVKIDSYLDNRIMIGDCGIIFSFISKEDIKNRNFANAVVDWDCC